MIEREIVRLLRTCEPPLPPVDLAAIQEMLTQPVPPVLRPSVNSWPHKAARFALVGSCVALLLVVAALWERVWQPATIAQPDGRAAGSLAARRLEDSLRSSQRLEQELIASLASSRGGQFAASNSDALQPSTADSLTESDRFAAFQAELRASESLWMLLENSPQDAKSLAESIVELYPHTPAAQRCASLALLEK